MTSLETINLNQYFGGKQYLNNINISAKSGTIVVLLGPNGAGKTTLLKTVMGLLKNPNISQNKNIIRYKNEIINRWPVHRRISSGLLYLPQHPSIFKQLSVIENLNLVYKYHNYWINDNNSKSNFNDEVSNWLNYINLYSHKNKFAGNLSGGQMRKLEVIRSIIMHPEIILLDEPFAGVDPKSIYELKEIFLKLSQKNIGILISDHNVDQLLSIANSGYVMIKGKIVAEGNIKDIINNKETQNLYFGRNFYMDIANKYSK